MNCVEMLDNVLCMTMFRQYLSCIISLSVNMETLKKHLLVRICRFYIYLCIRQGGKNTSKIYLISNSELTSKLILV